MNCTVNGSTVPHNEALRRARELLAQRDPARPPAAIGTMPPQRPPHQRHECALQTVLCGWRTP